MTSRNRMQSEEKVDVEGADTPHQPHDYTYLDDVVQVSPAAWAGTAMTHTEVAFRLLSSEFAEHTWHWPRREHATPIAAYIKDQAL